MGNEFSSLVDNVHAKQPGERLAELRRQLQDPKVSQWISLGAKEYNIPIKVIKSKKKEKKVPSWEAWEIWEPDGSSINAWSDDLTLFWTSESWTLLLDQSANLTASASAFMTRDRLDGIRKRFLCLAFYDLVTQHARGISITAQRCQDAVESCWGIIQDDVTLQQIAQNVLRLARDGRGYHKVAEKHGVETLMLIPRDLDGMIISRGGSGYSKANEIIKRLDLAQKANSLRRLASRIRAFSLNHFIQLCPQGLQVFDISYDERRPCNSAQSTQNTWPPLEEATPQRMVQNCTVGLISSKGGSGNPDVQTARPTEANMSFEMPSYGVGGAFASESNTLGYSSSATTQFQTPPYGMIGGFTSFANPDSVQNVLRDMSDDNQIAYCNTAQITSGNAYYQNPSYGKEDAFTSYGASDTCPRNSAL